MTTITMGDMAQSFALRRQSAALKADQQALSTAMTTGQVADAGQHLRGDFRGLAALDGSLSRLEAYRGAGVAAAGLAQGMQAALDSIGGLTEGLAHALSEPAVTGNVSGVVAAAATAHGAFLSSVAVINADHAGTALFGGTTPGAPLAEGEVILAALEAATAEAADVGTLVAAVAAWFEAPDGFAAFYRGGDGRAPMAVGAQDTVAVDVTAMDPGVRDTLKALSLGALLDRGRFADAPVARTALAGAAGDALLQATEARTALQSRIGATEARIAAIATRNAAETSALKIARNDLTAADPYETAVRFEAVSTQIETLHAVTARLSRMSLVDFL